MKTSKIFYFLISAITIGTTGSCIDTKYDLKDQSLNKNMSIFNNGVSLPVGSVQEINLSQFIDTEGDNIIKEGESGYYLSEDGDADAINIDIDNTEINNNGSSLEEVFKQENPFAQIFSNDYFTFDRIKLPISKYKDEFGPVIYELVKDALEGTVGENGDRFELELSDEEGDRIEEKFSIKIDDVPEEIINIYNIKFEEFPIIIKLTAPNINSLTDQLVLNKDFKIEIPSNIILSEDNELHIIENSETGQKFIDLSGTIINTESTVLEVKISGVDFGNEGVEITVDPETGKRVIKYEDSFKFHGGAYIQTILNTEETKKEFLRIPMELKTEAISVTAKEIRGQFDIESSEESIKIDKNDLPDFLSENNIIIDATHTSIELIISNEDHKLPTDLPINAKIVSIKNEIAKEPIDARIMIEADKFTQEGNKFLYKYIISDNEIEKEGYQSIKIEKLNDLLYDIPDSIKFNAKIDSDEILDLEIQEKNNINVAFSFNVPLEFGKDLNISYTDTIDGIHGSLGGIKTTGVRLAGKLEYNIPVNMQLTASAIDTDGNTLDGVNITITPEDKIKKGTHDFSIVITSEDKELIAEKLDGIALKITLTNEDYDENSSDQIKPTDSIYLKDLKISVLGGIEIDADDF